jgi:hypothetical protein
VSVLALIPVKDRTRQLLLTIIGLISQGLLRGLREPLYGLTLPASSSAKLAAGVLTESGDSTKGSLSSLAS